MFDFFFITYFYDYVIDAGCHVILDYDISENHDNIIMYSVHVLLDDSAR